MENQKTTKLIRLEEDLHKLLKLKSAKSGIPMSFLLSSIVRKHYKDNQKQK